MADRCPGSGLPARRLHLSAPQLPGCQRGSGRLGQAEGASADTAQPWQTPPSPGRDCGRGVGAECERAGGARASRWHRLLRRSPRLPEGRAGAGAGRGVAERGARAGGQPPRLAAGPTPPRPPGLRHPPSPGFCEVALTWRSLRGSRSAPAPVTARSPLTLRWSPRDLQKRAASSSSSRPGPAEADLSPSPSGVPRRSRLLKRNGAAGSGRALPAAGGPRDPRA
ncbi:uncharacterized protein [Callorhinus ursinus]|uniref:uncharacterized protein n=1 Tax=Callorhinus ursinus TaxID=34884 RepID=UPI003CD000CF